MKTPQATPHAFIPAYRRYVLAAMTAVYMLNFVDRGLMMLLLQPIKEDLGLSDTQLGFLTGIAFAMFYATLGLPIARWADRGNRVTIASLAIGLWGLTIMACVLVTNYTQLVIARIAAAVGESGCAPPTYSLLGDYFPEPAERSRAMGIYVSGSTLSALVSLGLGGWLAETYNWRTAFFLMGIPGLIVAVIFKLTIAEPRLRAARSRLPVKDTPPFATVLMILWRQQSCRHLIIGLIALFLLSLGLSPWYAAFLFRNHGIGTAELGLWLGMIVGIGGTFGVLLGGQLAGTWLAGKERAQLRLVAVTIVLLLPCLIAFLILPGKYQAIAALVPIVISFNFLFGPVFALLQRLVAGDMRATTLAVVMLLANLIGMGLGPQIVGILSDLMAHRLGAESLRYAMIAMSSVALWAGWHFWVASWMIERELQRTEPPASLAA